MKSYSLLIVLAALFVSPYAFAQIPSCPCDTVELPNGTSGDDIVDILCPGGDLAEGNVSFLTPDLVGVVGPGDEDPGLGYQVLSVNGTNGCGIFGDNVATLPIQLTDEEYENCRQRLILGCNLSTANPIPTLSEWGMIAMAGVLGMIGLYVASRRRKAAA